MYSQSSFVIRRSNLNIPNGRFYSLNIITSRIILLVVFFINYNVCEIYRRRFCIGSWRDGIVCICI